MLYRYNHPEFFVDWEKPDFHKYSGKWVLYGAAVHGAEAYYALSKKGVEIFGFCDGNPMKQQQSYYDHPVMSPEELFTLGTDTPILLCSYHADGIRDVLVSKGFTQIFDCVSLFMEVDFSDFETNLSFEQIKRTVDLYISHFFGAVKAENKYLDLLYLRLTTRCTLRCRWCDAYISYYERGTDCNADDMLTCIDKITDAYETIRMVNLFGGEPLLYRQLPEIIQALVKKKSVEGITIITNGTLLLNDSLIDLLKRHEVILRISDYGDYSYKMNELVSLCKQNNIRYEINFQSHWFKPAEFLRLNLTETELKDKFVKCIGCRALYLYDGKAFLCNDAEAMYALNLIDMPESCYVDVLNFSGSPKDLCISIQNYLYKTEYLEVCKYCTGIKTDNLTSLPVAEQTTETFKFPALR